MNPAAMSRRTALACGALVPVGLALAACSAAGSSTSAAASGSAGTELSPQPSGQAGAEALASAVQDEWLMVARYEAAIAAHPDLGAKLGPIRDQHVAHATALGAARPAELPPAGRVPAGQAKAVALLVAAENAARRQRIEACCRQEATGAGGTDLTAVLAQIAASEAAHAAYLAGVSA